MKTLTLISFYSPPTHQRGITYTLNGRKGSCFVPEAIKSLTKLRKWLSMALSVIVAPPNISLAAFEAQALERLVMDVPGASGVKARQIRTTDLKSLKLKGGVLMASMRACKHQGTLALLVLSQPQGNWERREQHAAPSA